MSRRIIFGLGAITATALTLSTALPAQAHIPTISEVRYLNGPAGDDEVIGLALTSDAQTAVLTSDADQAWVVDVSSNVATEILGMSRPGAVVLDSQETYAYIVSDFFEVTKVDLATAEVDDVWTDTSSNFYATELFLSPDGARLFGVGVSGSWPNFTPGVVALDFSSGVISQYDAPNLGLPNQAAYHEASGQILIPYYVPGSTGFDIFDTASNTFTDDPWTAAGALVACDSQSGVIMCLVDDSSPYLAKVSLAGSVLDTVSLDFDAANAMLRLPPDGSLAFVQTYSTASNPGVMQSFDIANMSALPTLLTTVIEDPENMEIAADAGQLWIHGYYGGSEYDGGYHVVQYAEQEGGSGEELANTGADLAISGAVAVIGALALGAGVMTRRVAHRQRS
jgi:hypothetical protein